MTETTPENVHSDAPLTTAKHQREVAHEIAEERHWDTAALAGKTVTINRPRQELYEFWRDFKNLAAFMENIERAFSPGFCAMVAWNTGLQSSSCRP